jgi:hypothetical protein
VPLAMRIIGGRAEDVPYCRSDSDRLIYCIVDGLLIAVFVVPCYSSFDSLGIKYPRLVNPAAVNRASELPRPPRAWSFKAYQYLCKLTTFSSTTSRTRKFNSLRTADIMVSFSLPHSLRVVICTPKLRLSLFHQLHHFISTT